MSGDIYGRVCGLKKRCLGLSLAEICEECGIKLLYKAMGDFKGACKGFFIRINRLSYITVNSELSEQLQKVVICHELGHAALHKDYQADKNIRDISLFNDVSRFEYEANLFAAEFLIEDRDVFELLGGELSFSGAAAALNVPAELLDIKLRAMKKRGILEAEPPMMARGDFLKKF